MIEASERILYTCVRIQRFLSILTKVFIQTYLAKPLIQSVSLILPKQIKAARLTSNRVLTGKKKISNRKERKEEKKKLANLQDISPAVD
jgi:hypothetical protein